jgi:hypothetical protein
VTGHAHQRERQKANDRREELRLQSHAESLLKSASLIVSILILGGPLFDPMRGIAQQYGDHPDSRRKGSNAQEHNDRDQIQLFEMNCEASVLRRSRLFENLSAGNTASSCAGSG